MRKSLILVPSLLLLLAGCSKKDATLSGYSTTQSVGSSAHDLLSDEAYTSVKVEIQYMPGFQPDPASVTNLISFLQARLNKPDGIELVQTEVPAIDSASLTLQSVADLEKKYRTAYTSGSQLGVYFLFTNGAYTDDGVLGVAYWNTSMCLFGQTIQDNSGGSSQPTRVKLETTVLEHEFGHILGLVNVGSPMQTDHIDEDHGHHCNNTNCLMYYAVNTKGFLSFLRSNTIPELDANCLADLQANGGK